MGKIRVLNAEEIEVRMQKLTDKGAILLLYKNARVDMDILDETFGTDGWKRRHSRDNANCTVSVYSERLKEWIDKEDTGTESYSDKEKGQASDSFKRACFNIGIGRELYTAPFIFVPDKLLNRGTDRKCYDKFYVEAITYDDKRRIEKISIKNQNDVRVFVKK